MTEQYSVIDDVVKRFSLCFIRNLRVAKFVASFENLGFGVIQQ